MWVILVGIIAAVVSASVLYTEKWDNPNSSVNQSETVAKQMADNLMGYTTLVKQYAEANNTYNIALNNRDIEAFATYNLRLMGNYRSTEIRISEGYDSYTKYVLVSWDSTPNQTNPQQFVISLADNIEKFMQLNKAVYSSLIPQIYVLKSGCSATLANAYQGMMNNKSSSETFFYNICANNIPQDYKIGKYNLLIQSID
jgi:hypothetical protein